MVHVFTSPHMIIRRGADSAQMKGMGKGHVSARKEAQTPLMFIVLWKLFRRMARCSGSWHQWLRLPFFSEMMLTLSFTKSVRRLFSTTVSTAVRTRSEGSWSLMSSRLGFFKAACLYSSRSCGIGVGTAVRTGGGSCEPRLVDDVAGV